MREDMVDGIFQETQETVGELWGNLGSNVVVMHGLVQRRDQCV